MIYFDNAATTPIKDKVVSAMMPYFTTNYGNPSSHHKCGDVAAKAIVTSRNKISEILGCKSSELIFTSCGSESDNQALITGATIGFFTGKKHIISTSYEHHAILNTLKYLSRYGFRVTYLDPYHITPDEVEKNITDETCLVSIMHTNNEIGAINPINDIALVCKKHNVLFHSDCTQFIGHSKGYEDLSNVDMISFSGHKFNAPKGIGGLIVRDGITVSSLIHGGQQESGRRAGTENVPYIVGMAKALELSTDVDINKIVKLNNQLKLGLSKLPNTYINGDYLVRCPYIVNARFMSITAESLQMMLDSNGICVSSGSACNSESDEPSHVLKSIGLTDEQANSSIRFSLSDDNTEEEINYVLQTLSVILSLVKER